MTAERTAEEWGRVAVSLPGWRWMPGMRYFYGGFSASTGASEDYIDRLWEDDAGPYDHAVLPAPDPDDPATAGCLLALLGNECDSLMLLPNERGLFEWHNGSDWEEQSLPLGRACIAAAAALGRWPRVP